MPGYVIALLVVGMVVMDSIIVWAIFSSFRAGTWAPLAKVFPPVSPTPGAVRREFESFSFGMFNLGWSLHVAVDEAYLHLYPAWLLRVVGATPMSVPWSAVTLRPKAPKRGLIPARLGKQDIRGPAWCLRLADPDATGAGASR